MRGVLARMKFIVHRGKHRKEQTHFKISDQMETMSKSRIFMISLLYVENEETVQNMLETRTIDYVDSGA